ncbi:26S proteasome non-ATPase regulatory subunit 9 [Clonorchis sinensis]|uniref:26S proteasome non-ATPase regulatory subunit 9 n=1 Tax=Clonorchis sinensis TaxID=79923 RepID=A0A8T1MBI8_CLOSI|nr:26S proteasome non-ATPase regulatory subunit 9 [Clonorchis sinensis]
MAPDTLKVAQMQLKARIGDLSSRKANLEKEIQTFSEVLQTNGNVGLHAPLVDREGFPRSDIDLVAVRVARNNIIRLNNDHKQVMNELEGCLHHLHELARQAGPTSQAEVKEEPKIQSTTTAKAPQLRPFLVVEEVQPGGVAESVGLEVGDRITQFGSVSAENFENLRDISTVMQNTPPNIPILLTVIKPSKDNSSYELELKKPSGGISLGMRVKPL